MAAYKGANVTKYDNGGSGDNVISDGYIKSVEKVWMDTYTFTATAISTADTITIANIGPGRKITGIDVYFPAITPSNSTILVGVTGDTDKFIQHGSTVRLSSAGILVDSTVITMNNPDGFLYETTGTTVTPIILMVGVTAITAPTAGTIKTVVKYT
jgi:hypothetical protein